MLGNQSGGPEFSQEVLAGSVEPDRVALRCNLGTLAKSRRSPVNYSQHMESYIRLTAPENVALQELSTPDGICAILPELECVTVSDVVAVNEMSKALFET